jgi:hypothetical protein
MTEPSDDSQPILWPVLVIIIIAAGLILPDARRKPFAKIYPGGGAHYWRLRFEDGWAAIANDDGANLVYATRGPHGRSTFYRVSKKELTGAISTAVRVEVGRLVTHIALENPPGLVTDRHDIGDLLRVFTGKEFDDDPQTWRAWWDAHSKDFQPPADVDARFVAVWIARDKREAEQDSPGSHFGRPKLEYLVAESHRDFEAMLNEVPWTIFRYASGGIVLLSAIGVTWWLYRRRCKMPASNQ